MRLSPLPRPRNEMNTTQRGAPAVRSHPWAVYARFHRTGWVGYFQVRQTTDRASGITSPLSHIASRCLGVLLTQQLPCRRAPSIRTKLTGTWDEYIRPGLCSHGHGRLCMLDCTTQVIMPYAQVVESPANLCTVGPPILARMYNSIVTS